MKEEDIKKLKSYLSELRTSCNILCFDKIEHRKKYSLMAYIKGEDDVSFLDDETIEINELDLLDEDVLDYNVL